MCLISTGVSAIGKPPLSVRLIEQRVRNPVDRDEDDDPEHRRKVERAERRQDPPEDPQVRIADVVEETLDAVQPRRVGQPDPGRDDVREDEQRVDADEDVDEALDPRDGIQQQYAHQDCVRAGRRESSPYAWLKKPPRSSQRARSSALTSTFRGVSRNTLSATRCMPPSSAYVRPLAKSINRFERSASELCRLRMTGIDSLNLSAICCASLKLRGTTRWTVAGAATGPAAGGAATPRSRVGRSTSVRSAPGSVQSSNSRSRRRGASLRTLGRS